MGAFTVQSVEGKVGVVPRPAGVALGRGCLIRDCLAIN